MVMAAMVVSVAARPSAEGLDVDAKAVRHVRAGAVGEVFRREG